MNESDVNDHIDEIIETFATRVEVKYREGQKEHGGNLRTKGNLVWLLNNLEEEIIDAFVYVHVLRERVGGIFDGYADHAEEKPPVWDEELGKSLLKPVGSVRTEDPTEDFIEWVKRYQSRRKNHPNTPT